MHKQKNEKEVKEVVSFIKYYFELSGEKLGIFYKEFKSDFSETNKGMGKMYDIFIYTPNDLTERVAHACGWSYLKGRKMTENISYPDKGDY